MRYLNTTPFPTLCFESVGPEGVPIHTIVVRATTTILPGASLRLSVDQLPLNITDRYFGKPGESSLKYPSDLAPFKPRADIIVVGTTYPPTTSARAWIVAVTVGQHKKSLMVTGPRDWKKSLLGWSLPSLKPAAKQPVRYESAFGGALVFPNAEGDSRTLDVFRSNPVGKGWWSPIASKLLDDVKIFPVQQFYSASSDLPPVFGKQYAVEGLGAIAPTWAFRQKHAGRWHEIDSDSVTLLPSDFEFHFFNCAHPDLVVPHLKGDEKVRLVNLTPEGMLQFQLPGHSVFVVARFAGKQDEIVPALLDTLIIEPDQMQATLVWRATLPVDSGVKRLEARLLFNEDAAQGGGG